MDRDKIEARLSEISAELFHLWWQEVPFGERLGLVYGKPLSAYDDKELLAMIGKSKVRLQKAIEEKERQDRFLAEMREAARPRTLLGKIFAAINGEN